MCRNLFLPAVLVVLVLYLTDWSDGAMVKLRLANGIHNRLRKYDIHYMVADSLLTKINHSVHVSEYIFDTSFGHNATRSSANAVA